MTRRSKAEPGRDIRGNANCFFTPVGLAARSRHNFPGRGRYVVGSFPGWRAAATHWRGKRPRCAATLL